MVLLAVQSGLLALRYLEAWAKEVDLMACALGLEV